MKRYSGILISVLAASLAAFGPATAQIALEEYRGEVAAYSRQLKIAASGSAAASGELGRARTGYLPSLSLDGSFTKTFHRYEGIEPWTFSVLPQVVQTLYGGGSVRATVRQAELGYDIALCEEAFTRLRGATC